MLISMRRLADLYPLRWLGQRDRGFAALRRATRTAIIMPGMFALGDKVIGNAQLATFAAFGSFAMLLLVDFGGPMAERLQAQAALLVTGGVFVCLATLASQAAWLAAVAMAVAGFGVIFAGVVSSVLAGATTALLLAFILPVSLAAPPSAVPDRLAGWAMAGGASLVAIALLWPAPARDRLRGAASAACRALAARLRAGVAYLLGDSGEQSAQDREHAVAQADQAVEALGSAFLATPYRPTGLSTPARTTVRLVDELDWLNSVINQPGIHLGRGNRAALRVKAAAAGVLDRAADLLDSRGGSSGELDAALTELAAARAAMQQAVMADLPVRPLRPAGHPAGNPAADGEPVAEFITSLDPAFRAEELSYAVSLIARNAELTATAEQRNWRERWLGRQPEGVPGTLSAARERITSYLEPHSVWLHNSLRGAAGLGLAVLAARLAGVQHSFWVVLGALSVLRSNALNTGQDAVRAVLGTLAGFIAGAALLVGIGTNTTLLWFLLPLAVFLAGIAPAAISFAGGQAAFTLTLVILFNIIQPAGWRVGLVRIEDVALGVGVSLVVGVLFWPRGAAAALRQALAEAYAASADYLAAAVRFGMSRGDPAMPALPAQAGHAAQANSAAVANDAARAAAASRRLDDAFRTYLAERGAKRMPLADVAGLVTGVAGLRLEADAVLDLWRSGDARPGGDVAAAREEILALAARVTGWYDTLAATLITGGELPEPLAHDRNADGRLVRAVRRDLLDNDGKATATAIRMIWTGDHLDVARRLQAAVISPARATATQPAARRIIPPLPRRFPALLR